MIAFTRRDSLKAGALAVTAIAAPRTACAQAGAMRLIYPYAPGGAGDALARIIAERIGAAFNTTMIVDNRTGADGRIGVRAVKEAAPDGQTLLYTPFGPMVLHPTVYTKLPYDTVKDFAPVSRVVTIDFALSTGPETGAKSMAELVAWLRANPGKASYGVPGAGTVPHFLGAGFGAAAGIDMRVVAYKGTTPALADVIGGQIPLAVTPLSDAIEQHKAGALRLLAVSGAQRSPFAPDVPTLRESGVDLAGQGWYAVYAPAGTPAATIAKINAAIREAVLSDAGRARMTQLGFTPIAGDPQDLADVQKRDTDFWAPAIRASGFKAEE